MELGILLRIHFFYRQESIERTEDEDRRARIEGPFHRIGNDSFFGCIGDTDPGKEYREEISDHRAGITESRLNGISRTFLLLIDRIADHHLKRLHRDINGGIEKHETKETEPHRSIQAKPHTLLEGKVTGIGQENHHRDRNERSYEKIELTATKELTEPCFIREDTNERLNDHTHQRRKDPEERQLMGICAKRSKDSGDIGTLEGISDLHSEEAETQIKELCKR